MREGIRQRLIAALPEIADRVLEPHAASADTEKPYVALVQGIDSEESDWAGFRRLVEIWPYVTWTSFADVDALAKKIISALDDQLLTDPDTGEVFTCRYDGTVGDDTVDQDWNAITRGLRFSVLALQPTGDIPSEQPADPWLAALVDWTSGVLDTEWSVYHTAWPLGYVRPAVLWRIAGDDVREIGAAVEIRKRIVGHVIGETITQQNAGIVLATWKLREAIKIPLNIVERRYLTVIDARADHQADGFRTGQITVTLARKEAKPVADVPLIASVTNNGNIS